jgi:hypothetical protein
MIKLIIRQLISGHLLCVKNNKKEGAACGSLFLLLYIYSQRLRKHATFYTGLPGLNLYGFVNY